MKTHATKVLRCRVKLLLPIHHTPSLISDGGFHLITIRDGYLKATYHVCGYSLDHDLQENFFSCPRHRLIGHPIDTFLDHVIHEIETSCR
jgi:hypothetical protein